MSQQEYDAEERRVLRLRRAMEDLTASPAWREYEAILKAQISVRENTILNEPAASNGPTDPLGRLLQLETIKGALIGLKLALSTPQTIIAEAKEIVAARNSNDDPSGEGDDE